MVFWMPLFLLMPFVSMAEPETSGAERSLTPLTDESWSLLRPERTPRRRRRCFFGSSASAAGRAFDTSSSTLSSEPLTEDTEIYVADTMGEMGLWYRLVEVVFVGKSLVGQGGQNLLEPAAQGCAVLSGPHTTNFAQIAADLEVVGALCRVGDMDSLATAVEDLLDDGQRRAQMGVAAAAYATTQTEVLDRVVAALAPLLSRAAGKTPEPGTTGPGAPMPTPAALPSGSTLRATATIAATTASGPPTVGVGRLTFASTSP